MPVSSITADAVHEALERLRQAESLRGNPLLGLAAVERRLRVEGVEADPAAREWALGGLLVELVQQELERLRGTAAGRMDAARPVLDRRQLEADFAAGSPEREAWSCLYYRYTASASLPVREIADLAGCSTRQLRRRLGRGYARLADALRAAESAASEPVPPLTPPSAPVDDGPSAEMDERPIGYLPLPGSRFVGRERPRAELKRLLAERRLVTVAGPGGAGKTRLALQVASESRASYPDGLWFVDLAPLSEGDQVGHALATVLGLRPEPGCTLAATLAAFIAERCLLVVLDNCEHLIDACAELVRQLLLAGGEARILATSREPLRVEAESVLRLQGLALPAEAEDVDLETLARCASLQLFVDRAASVRPGFALTADNAADISEICRHLDGIPLAIELAAARARMMQPRQIAERLDDRFHLLRDGRRADQRHHATLQAVLDWSHDLLDEDERELFARLGVFGGRFDLSAAEAICSGRGIEDWQVLDLLGHLLDKSLLLCKEEGTELRYRMLESVRIYAVERLAESDQASVWRERHLEHALRRAEEARAGLEGPRQHLWVRELDAEYDDLRSALAWALEQGEAARALALSSALYRYWMVRGRWGEAEGLLRAALSMADADAGLPAYARAEQALGHLLSSQGQYEESRLLCERSQARFEAAGDLAGMAKSAYLLGILAYWQGDRDEAERLFSRSLELYRQQGDRWGEGIPLNNLGLIARSRGDLERARQRFEAGVAIATDLGDRAADAASLNNLAGVMRDLGRVAEAEALCERGLAASRALGDGYGEAVSLYNLGELALRQGALDAAARHFQDSLAIRRRMGDRLGIANSLAQLGDLARLRGDLDSAHAQLGRALGLYQQLGARWHLASTLCDVATLSRDRSQPERALELLGAAVAICASLGAPSPLDGEGPRAVLEACVESLGSAAAEAAQAAGRAMDLDAAVAMALSG